MTRCFLLLTILAGYSCSSLTPHDNFKDIMDGHVGRKVDSPSSFLERYSRWVLGKKELENGNEEIEFFQGKLCHVFFEVDKPSRVIVGWRFEGAEEDCVIVP